MMHITFLEHSGFLVELDCCCLLFDWWKGDLPALPAVPLFVFASHRHHDHFDPKIFTLDDGSRPVAFVLGKDIHLTDFRRERWGVTPAVEAHCHWLGGDETLELDGLTVHTLPSTDEGVAFLVSCCGRTIYHAGDLNWWHWEGEELAWNRNMEVDFKRDLEPLRGVRLDLAFAPLDGRLGAAAGWGLQYLLETAQVERVFPMHQWEHFSLTQDFCAEHPALASRILPISENGQRFLLPD